MVKNIFFFLTIHAQLSNKVDNLLCDCNFPKHKKSNMNKVKTVVYLVHFILIDICARNCVYYGTLEHMYTHFTI